MAEADFKNHYRVISKTFWRRDVFIRYNILPLQKEACSETNVLYHMRISYHTRMVHSYHMRIRVRYNHTRMVRKIVPSEYMQLYNLYGIMHAYSIKQKVFTLPYLWTMPNGTLLSFFFGEEGGGGAILTWRFLFTSVQ